MAVLGALDVCSHLTREEGFVTGVGELNKLLSSAAFNNNQQLQGIEEEEERSTALQRQIDDKFAKTKLLEESTSKCDVTTKELHQQLKKTRDNCESVKKTSHLLEEHHNAVHIKLAQVRGARESKRIEQKQISDHYSQIWDRYKLKYEECPLAQEVISAANRLGTWKASVHDKQVQLNQVKKDLLTLEREVKKRAEQEKVHQAARSISINAMVVKIARQRMQTVSMRALSSAKVREMKKQTSAYADLSCALSKLTEKLIMAKTQAEQRLQMLQWPATNQNQHTFTAPGGNLTREGACVPTVNTQPKQSGIELGQTAMDVDQPDARDQQDTVDVIPQNNTHVASASQVSEAGNETMDTQPVALVENLPHSMPTTPRTPAHPMQGGDQSHGVSMQKPCSPLDNFRFSGRPMFSPCLSQDGGGSSPGLHMLFFQSWQGQNNQEHSAMAAANGASNSSQLPLLSSNSASNSSQFTLSAPSVSVNSSPHVTSSSLGNSPQFTSPAASIAQGNSPQFTLSAPSKALGSSSSFNFSAASNVQRNSPQFTLSSPDAQGFAGASDSSSGFQLFGDLSSDAPPTSDVSSSGFSLFTSPTNVQAEPSNSGGGFVFSFANSPQASTNSDSSGFSLSFGEGSGSNTEQNSEFTFSFGSNNGSTAAAETSAPGFSFF